MWLSSIHLVHYRNYADLSVSFSKGLNIFIGDNAQGKTNILEAIYFLALTRSHRTRHDKDLIQFGENSFLLSGEVQKTTSSIPLELSLTDKGRISKVNHLKQAKLSDYVGNLTVVLFAPEDLQLIKGSPSLRRKFMDLDLGQIKTLYLSDLSAYNHVLKQRNSYLKSTESIDTNFLDVLDEQLADFGSRVMKHRSEFLTQLEKFAHQHHYHLSNGKENLKIQYHPSFPYSSLNELKETFYNELQRKRKRDCFKKNTGIGPHRDDVHFFINGIDASFGSQGQHRSLILSLKMAEIDLIKQTTSEAPLLLLDDVMSELDNSRQMKLLETISDSVQTFITTTSLEHLEQLPVDLKLFKIKKGELTEEK